MSGPAFCRLPAERLPQRLRTVGHELRPDLLTLDEGPLMLRLTYAASAERLADVTRFIQEESACCPFLGFVLDVSMQEGRIGLIIRSLPEGAPMLRTLARAVAPAL